VAAEDLPAVVVPSFFGFDHLGECVSAIPVVLLLQQRLLLLQLRPVFEALLLNSLVFLFNSLLARLRRGQQ
jgi:hypothetical protein